MTPPDVSAWLWWALATGAVACIWLWGSAALDALERRQYRRRTVHDIHVDPDMAAWNRIVAAERERIPGTEPELEEVGMTVVTVDICQCERPHHANGLCARRVEPGTEFCLGCIGGCFDD